MSLFRQILLRNLPSPIEFIRFVTISTSIVSDSTLAKYCRDELDEMRNEIYASHGFIFASEKWRTFFMGKQWYKPENIENELSFIEKINLIKISEQANNQ